MVRNKIKYIYKGVIFASVFLIVQFFPLKTFASDPQTFLHYAPNGNFANGGYDASGDPGSDGFNLADVSSLSNADGLPSGVQALYWLDGSSGTTTAFEDAVTAAASDPKVWGFFIGSGVYYGQTANIKAAADYIHTNAPGKEVFIIADNSGSVDSPSYAATPSNTDADLVGLDAYPMENDFTDDYDSNVIPNAVSAAETAGWTSSKIVPVYQAFGNVDDYVTPTETNEETIIGQWDSAGITTPVFDYAYSWGVQNSDNAISNTSGLQSAFATHNTLNAPSTSLHYSPNSNFANGAYNAAGDPGTDGFNLADVYDPSSTGTVDTLPTGVKALIFLPITGDTSGFESTVNMFTGDSNVAGWYIADDAADSNISLIKAEADYIHAHNSGQFVFIVPYNDGNDSSPSFEQTPSNTDADYAGCDPYPVNSSGVLNLSIIHTRVTAEETAGWSQSSLIPLYQAFGGGGYSNWGMPTQSQEVAILNEWAQSDNTPTPAFDYAYSWGVQVSDSALSGSTALQAVFAVHNN